jgi:hypothetical protein
LYAEGDFIVGPSGGSFSAFKLGFGTGVFGGKLDWALDWELLKGSQYLFRPGVWIQKLQMNLLNRYFNA